MGLKWYIRNNKSKVYHERKASQKYREESLNNSNRNSHNEHQALLVAVGGQVKKLQNPLKLEITLSN